VRERFLNLRRLRLSLWTVALLLAFGVSGSARAQSPAPIGDGVNVEITQLNWLSDQQGTTLIPYSRIGVAELSFDSQAASLLTSPMGAYLNLYTGLDGSGFQWSVQNLFLRFDSFDAVLNVRPTVQFDLGNLEGEPVSVLHVQGSLTPDPVVEPQPMPWKDDSTKHPGPPLPAPVTTLIVDVDDYHVGGYLGAGSGQPGTPAAAARPWQGSGSRPVAWASTLTEWWLLPEVAEDWMGCAPGGVARSISYMAARARVKAPTPQQIYNSLYWYMETNVYGWGTWTGDVVGGKQDYVNDNRLPIDTDLYGWGNNNGTVMDALANGGDVEIFISWRGGGGHVAMVVGIVRMADGSYQIYYIDDPEQGDGWEENELHVINVKPDGDFGTGWVDGFLVEEFGP